MNFSREVTIISKLNHPSVLKYIGFSSIDFKKRQRPIIITEYASNGSLDDLLLSSRQSLTSILDDTFKLIIIYGIAAAMSYLHSHNIIHRDLKPANILIDKIRYLKIGIDSYNSESMYMYANLLRYGISCQMNKEEAFRYYKKAAKCGFLEGMTICADMLREGEGCNVNKEKAIEYYEMAANFGDSEGMIKYADMLRVGEGCNVNKEEAIKYYEMASDKGNITAMLNYFYMVVNDNKSFIDTEEAIKYLKIAC